MSEERMDNMENMEKVEEVDAEVVQEGTRAVTMEEVEKAGYNAGSGQESEAGASAGTAYEETADAGETGGSKTLGIISMILGIFSTVCCCTCWLGLVAGVAAIILGIVSLKNEPAAKTFAIVGIACGGVGTVIGLIGAVTTGIIGSMGASFNDSAAGSELIERFEEYMNL